MAEPKDDDLCLACEHKYCDHSDGDPADTWKQGNCECCNSGEFIGQPLAVDDMDEYEMQAWTEWNHARRKPKPPTAGEGGGA